MFALMNFDYRRLRQPRFVLTLLSGVLLALIGLFFLDKSHETHRWIRLGPIQPATVRDHPAMAIVLFLWFLEARRPPSQFRRE